MRRFWIPLCLIIVTVLGIGTLTLQAELTAAHRRDLTEMKKKIARVGGMLRLKRTDEAQEVIDEAESMIEQIIEEAMIEREDRALKSLLTDLERQKTALAKAMGKDPAAAEKVVFVEDVAPLIENRCLRCHGATNARGGLRLDTLAGWRQGGQSGQLLLPGNPQRSLIIMKLLAPENQGRMPAQGEPFSREEIQKIGLWIQQGADVAKADTSKSLADLIYDHEKASLNVQIPKPKGNESVSFTRDMAPWMSNLCLRCHNSQRKSGGLSVETFYDLMKGGDSGEVIIPGDMENSRFFRLVGGLELPRMPADNQARITRKNYEDMKQWFREGNTFDGSDPRTNIRTYVRSEADMAADEFRRKTDEEVREHRKAQSQAQLKRAVPNDSHHFQETASFLMSGNVEPDRLEEVGKWAEAQLAELHKMFGGSGQPWRGRLAVHVMKDRFSYEEFNEVVERRRADGKMYGHSKVSANHEDAYVVIQDLGDADSLELTTRKNLTEHISGAYLQQNGSALPNWLVAGTGVLMSTDARADSKRVAEMKQLAWTIVPTLQRPEDIFNDGTFSPGTIGPVGYTMVRFLIDSQGAAKFARFVKELQQGRNVNQALQQVYNADAAAISRTYVGSLR